MRCPRPCRATVAMLAIGCALTACGSADRHIKSVANSGAISVNAGVASYRAALTAAIAALDSDTRQYFTACAPPLSVSRCEQWVSSDEQLIGQQVLGPISNAKVPAALAGADKRLHRIINRIFAADVVLAKALADNRRNSRAVQAAIDRVGSAPGQIQVVLDQLAPGVTSTRMQ